MGKFLNRKVLTLLILMSLVSLLPNINNYQFRGEEALRTMVAYEMDKMSNYIQPTLLGEPYYNKPPLFNWLIIVSSKLIPWSELTSRSVTLIALILILLVTYILAFNILNDRFAALMSALIFISFSDILFWYGYLAEIDITLTLFNTTSLLFLILGYKKAKISLLAMSGFVIGLSFLLKGLPAYAFWVLSITAIIIKYKYNKIVIKGLIIGSLSALIAPATWLFLTNDPSPYLYTFLKETISKVKSESGLLDLILHLTTYPLLTLKQLLPTSLIILYLLLKLKIKNRKPLPPLTVDIKFLIILSFLNYLPYLISAQAKGRYVLPLFPVLAIIFSYLIYKNKEIVKVLILCISFLIILRFIFGYIGLPLLEKNRGPLKRGAYLINEYIKPNEKVACNCRQDERKAVCLYLNFLRNEVIKSPRLTPRWKYLISCIPIKEQGLEEVLKIHIRKEQYVWLYLRQSQDLQR